jgi:hypothetical protein
MISAWCCVTWSVCVVATSACRAWKQQVGGTGRLSALGGCLSHLLDAPRQCGYLTMSAQ